MCLGCEKCIFNKFLSKTLKFLLHFQISCKNFAINCENNENFGRINTTIP